MKRIDCILANSGFAEYLRRIATLEADRIFCRHDLAHMLDVCRVAWILSLEGGYGEARDVVYAAGLLHDIGRWQEYETGCDHAEAGAELAGPILEACGYDDDEKTKVKLAILGHRNGEERSTLGELLYKADKISRPCASCAALNVCKRFPDHQAPEFEY